jgi:replication factor C large subunit
MIWSEKYRPKNITQMVGNEQPRSTIVEWFTKWKKGTKPILLVGPPGTGKTTIATLTAKHFGYDMIELNASDVRNKSKINEILSPVLGSESVLGTPMMIFIDEVDGIHSRADYGGAETLIRIIKESTVPIVLAANSDISDKMRNIKKAVKTIYFKQLPPRLLKVYLEGILKKEHKTLGPGSLFSVIDKSRGDIRSMINLAQSMVTGFNPKTEKSFQNLNVEEGINAFFKAKSIEEARGILIATNIDPREKISAFYSSILTSNIKNKEKSRMLEIIADADVLYGRIRRTQQWRLLRYLNEILVRLFEPDTSVRYSKYSLSWPMLNRIRWDGRNIKSLSLSLANMMHVSQSTIATFYLPYILFMTKNKKLELNIDDTYDEIMKKEMERIK